MTPSALSPTQRRILRERAIVATRFHPGYDFARRAWLHDDVWDAWTNFMDVTRVVLRQRGELEMPW